MGIIIYFNDRDLLLGTSCILHLIVNGAEECGEEKEGGETRPFSLEYEAAAWGPREGERSQLSSEHQDWGYHVNKWIAGVLEPSETSPVFRFLLPQLRRQAGVRCGAQPLSFPLS